MSRHGGEIVGRGGDDDGQMRIVFDQPVEARQSGQEVAVANSSVDRRWESSSVKGRSEFLGTGLEALDSRQKSLLDGVLERIKIKADGVEILLVVRGTDSHVYVLLHRPSNQESGGGNLKEVYILIDLSGGPTSLDQEVKFLGRGDPLVLRAHEILKANTMH